MLVMPPLCGAGDAGGLSEGTMLAGGGVMLPVLRVRPESRMSAYALKVVVNMTRAISESTAAPRNVVSENDFFIVLVSKK